MSTTRAAASFATDLQAAWDEALAARVDHEARCQDGCRLVYGQHCATGAVLAEAEQRAYHAWFATRFPGGDDEV
jgi:hypothetical protein